MEPRSRSPAAVHTLPMAYALGNKTGVPGTAQGHRNYPYQSPHNYYYYHYHYSETSVRPSDDRQDVSVLNINSLSAHVPA